MMKSNSWSVLALVLVVLPACGIRKYTSKLEEMSTTGIRNSVYTEQEIAEDIDYFIRSVEEVSPFPYMMADSVSIHALALDLKKKGDRKGNALYLDFMRLSAAYNVGHIYTFPPESMLDEAILDGERFFPLFIKKNRGKWEVLGIIDSALSEKNIGNEVASINGLGMSQIMEKILPLVPNDGSRDERVGSSLPFLLWAINISHPFTVGIVNKETAGLDTFFLQGTNDLAKYRTQTSKGTQKELDDFITFEILDKRIGYINAKSFLFVQDNGVTKAFTRKLDPYFAELKEKGVTDLIIDLRTNSGGSSYPAEAILQRIAHKPYQQTGGSTMRVSAQFREFVDDLPWSFRLIVKNGMLKDYYKHPIGTNLEKVSEPTLPKKVKHRFSGQVYALIGSGTHSAAMMMANAIEDFDLGLVVGEPTVSIPRELSNALPMKTPNAQIAFTVPASLFTRANGAPNNYEPVRPDIVVETTEEDMKNNRDPVLRYVLEQIAGKE